jgi:hypothetical protein
MLRRFISASNVARFALFLNLAGTLLLAFSFLATSSDFRLITAANTDGYGKPAAGRTAYAICVNNYVLVLTDSAKNGIEMGENGCPHWDNASPAAVVTYEHPSLLWIGIVAIAIGFLIQLVTIPKTETPPTIDPPLSRAEYRRIIRDRRGS